MGVGAVLEVLIAARRRPSGNGGSVTSTGPQLWADLKAHDQRPGTGAIARYFTCWLSAGIGDRAGLKEARRPPREVANGRAFANSHLAVRLPGHPASPSAGRAKGWPELFQWMYVGTCSTERPTDARGHRVVVHGCWPCNAKTTNNATAAKMIILPHRMFSIVSAFSAGPATTGTNLPGSASW
jgi:hypothetical protein